MHTYLLRSCAAVNGLWFMKVEEKYGFDAALDLDAAVWAVMPKIQARQLKTARWMSTPPGGLPVNCTVQSVIRRTSGGEMMRITGTGWD